MIITAYAVLRILTEDFSMLSVLYMVDFLLFPIIAMSFDILCAMVRVPHVCLPSKNYIVPEKPFRREYALYNTFPV